MLGWLNRRRRLSATGQRRLMLALARAEEEIIRTHVQNALDVMEAVGDELSPGRALELYLDEVEVDDPQATIVAQRVRSRLEEDSDAP
jgi:DNA invertase Pin-like site-specific DNA recombinase